MTEKDKSAFYAPDAELIMAAVAIRAPGNFPDRFMYLDDVTAGCYAPQEGGGSSLWERIYKAGLIKDGAEYKYQSLDAIRDYLGVSNDELAPLLKYMNRPPEVVEAARNRMIEAAQRRSLARKLDKASRTVADPEQAVDSIVAQTTVELFGVTVASKKPGRTGAEVAKQYGKNTSWSRFPKPMIYRSQHPLDTTPFSMGAYNVILAPPGTGKTVLALWKAVETAQRGGYVLWDGWEMDADDLIDMVVSRFTGISYRALVDAREGEAIDDPALMAALSDEDRELRDRFLAEIFAEGAWGHRIRFLTGSDTIPLNNLLPLVRRLRAAGTCDLVVLDHLHIAKVLDERGRLITDPFQRFTAASSWARDIAAETGVPMYVAAQLSRSRKEAKQEGNEPNIYTMEMIRGSGAIEEDAFGVTIIQTVQYNLRTGEVARYTPPAKPLRRGEKDPGMMYGYVKALMGQVLKNRKGGGRLTTWVVPIVEGAFDYDLQALERAATAYIPDYTDAMIEEAEVAVPPEEVAQEDIPF